MNIVVVGGVGSGKSTVTANLGLALRGDCAVDGVDRMVRQIHLTPEAYFDDVEQVLWAEMTAGRSRDELRAAVFAYPELREHLEKMTSPAVLEQIRELKQKHHSFKVLEFPLFFEKASYQMSDEFDIIIVVDAPEEVRISRCLKRGWSMTTIGQVISTQANSAQRSMRIENIVKRNPKTLIFEVNTNCPEEQTICDVHEIANRIKQAQLKRVQDTRTKVGVIGGTFDPITKGHEHVIQEAQRLMDYVIVAVAKNPTKKTVFSDSERRTMLLRSIAGMLNPTRVILMETPHDELLASWASKQGAEFLIRGIRTSTDWEYEQQIQFVQNRIAPHMSMVHILTPRDLLEVSSTLIRNSMHLRDWELVIKGYVSEGVLDIIREKIRA